MLRLRHRNRHSLRQPFQQPLNSLLGSLLSFGRRGLRGNDLIECQVGEINGIKWSGMMPAAAHVPGVVSLPSFERVANHVERSRKGHHAPL